jgi:hypothetical protein
MERQMSLITFDRNKRHLTAMEQALATSVFKDKLPAWWRIYIGDGLGKGDRPYTWEHLSLFYVLHVGPTIYPDLSVRYRNLLIHELTHVWQYYNGYWVAPRSVWVQGFGAGYHYTLNPATDCWNDFNVEQQASIVEDWFKSGMSTEDDRYPFIEMIIRSWDAGEFDRWDTGEFKVGGGAALIDRPVQKLRELMRRAPPGSGTGS